MSGPPDLADWGDDTLAVWVTALREEQTRRRILARAADTVEHMQIEYLQARDHAEDGPPQWVAPTGAHDAYPQGYIVTHNGKTWESLTPANAWEPGQSGWREITDDDQPPAWVAPTGAHDAYAQGDRVTHNGQTWTSDLDANVWEPGAYGWTPDA